MLMFDIASVCQNYQKIVTDVLHNCTRAANIADDLTVHGRGVKEHDDNFFAVLHRLKDSGMTLNERKCKFRLPRLTFCGHDLGQQETAPSEEQIENDCMTRVVADAEQRGLVAVLTQLQDGQWRIIQKPHKSGAVIFPGRERGIGTCVVVRMFYLYVYGHEFELETDHKLLECIYSRTSKPSARIERWVLHFQRYLYRENDHC